jgi:hypothetical protein
MAFTPDEIWSHLRRLASVSREPLPVDPLDRRDPEFLLAERDFLGAACDAWYAPDLAGLDHLPRGARWSSARTTAASWPPTCFR